MPSGSCMCGKVSYEYGDAASKVRRSLMSLIDLRLAGHLSLSDMP